MNNKKRVKEWLIDQVSRRTNLPSESIDSLKPLRAYRIYAKEFQELTKGLESLTGGCYYNTLFYDYPTIDAVADYVAEKEACRQSGKKENVSSGPREEIAVVGMACRFPGGCNSPEQLWEFLSQGGDGITEVPETRWDAQAYYDSDPKAQGKANTCFGGFLENIELFDASHFGITPREAKSMDVQQRIALEVCWEALEDAAELGPALASSRTGVFLGVSLNDYTRNALNCLEEIDFYHAPNSYNSLVANRISYTFGLHGPSVVIDTACSSSLVSVHVACQSLLAGECSLALCGGVAAMTSPEMTVAFSKGNLMASDGHCKTFDAAADGYVRSEGCGIVVLKRLKDALSDGNRILGLIKGSAVNHCGRSNGISAPSGLAQQQLVWDALEQAGVAPSEIQYVEAHGTGTYVGDPIEVNALGRVLAQGRQQDNPLVLGSIKANIGHAESAAGVAGLVKVLLMLRQKKIPKQIGFHSCNPQIKLKDIPALVPTETMEWAVPEGSPRLAGVSSFGIGGTNAHLVVSEYVDKRQGERQEPSEGYKTLFLSAKKESVLRELCQKFLGTVKEQLPSIDDVAHTLALGRARMPYRLAVTAESTNSALEKLTLWLKGQVPEGVAVHKASSNGTPEIAFMFTGQGAQYSGMGLYLYKTAPVFRRELDRCGELLARDMDVKLQDLMFEKEYQEVLQQTQYTQPCLFSFEYALAKQWMAWGIYPTALIGHSVGEYVAACLAGVFSLPDALHLIANRAKLMQQLPQGGGMLAVSCDLARVRFVLEKLPSDAISVAAVNSPRNTVISGDLCTLEQAKEAFANQGVLSTPLQVSHAFHSPLMKPMLSAYDAILQEINFYPPTISIVSNVTGNIVDGSLVSSPDYWRQHIINPVLFQDGIHVLEKQEIAVFLEIGPHPVLSNLAKASLSKAETVILPSSLRGNQTGKVINESIGRLFTLGFSLEGDVYPGKKLALPTYPFHGERYWYPTARQSRKENIEKCGLKGGRRVCDSCFGVIYEFGFTFNSSLIRDHKIGGSYLFPGNGLVAAVCSAIQREFPKQGFRLMDVRICEALVLDHLAPDDFQIIQLYLTEGEQGERRCRLLTCTSKGVKESHPNWRENLTCRFELGDKGLWETKEAGFGALLEKGADRQTADMIYNRLEEVGFSYGQSFRWIESLEDTGKEIHITLSRPEQERGESCLEPGLLDACAQGLLAARLNEKATYVFAGYDSFFRSNEAWDVSRVVLCNLEGSQQEGYFSGDCIAYGEGEKPVFQILGLKLLQRAEGKQTLSCLSYHWEAVEHPSSEQSEERKKWLILADQNGIGDWFSQLVAVKGDPYCVVYASKSLPSLNTVDTGVYFIDPENEAHYSELLKKVGEVHRVVHFWSLDMSLPREEEVLDFKQQGYGYGSALLLVQAYLRQVGCAYPKCWFVTQEAQCLGREERIQFSQAGLWGFGKVLAHECGELWGGLVDLSHQGQGLSKLFHLIRSNNPCVTLAAIRHGELYALRLAEQAGLGEGKTKSVQIVPGKTYLIAGGSGGLGQVLAKWLVAQGANQLIILGRKPHMPITMSLPDDVKMLYYACDVADKRQLTETMEQINREFGLINGVFHLAGQNNDASLPAQTIQHYQDVFMGKVAGGWNLHTATLGLDLDFFVVYSSVAAWIGTKGQANYAAANAALEALVDWRIQQGLPGIVIGWGLWSDAGMGAGMTALGKQLLVDCGIIPMEASGALTVLGEILSGSENKLMVSHLVSSSFTQYCQEALPGFLTSHFEAEPSRQQEEKTATASAPKEETAAPAQSHSVSSGEDPIQKQILKRVGEAVWIEDYTSIDINENLLNLGLDSLVIMGLRKTLRSDFRVEIPYKDFLESRTIRKLADLVRRCMAPGLEEPAPGKVMPSDDQSVGEPFPLTDVQYAYWVGRCGNLPLGDVSCHLYVEVDIWHLDLARLEWAVNRLIQRHGMLHTVFLPDGTQQVVEVSPYSILVEDLCQLEKAQAADRLREIRSGLSHIIHNETEGHLFQISAALLTEEKTRLQISLDLLIADGFSFPILIHDLTCFYNKRENELEPLSYTFQDYIQQEQEQRSTPDYQKAKEYWEERAKHLPSAPALPQAKSLEEVRHYQFHRRSQFLPRERWERLKALASKNGLTPSGVLLACYAYVLSKWSNSNHFSLVMTLMNRQPFHPDVEKMVGDFTSLNILEVELEKMRSFSENAASIQTRFWEDMEHSSYSGVEVLREMNRQKGGSESNFIPVVFTSMLAHSGRESTIMLPEQPKIQLVYSISQTPQVALDFQLFEQEGGLLYLWDSVDELYEEGVLDAMFEAYQTLLADLLDRPATWEEALPVQLPKAQKELRERLNRREGILAECLLHEGFLQQAHIQPQALALVHNEMRLSYGQLAGMCQDICEQLAENGVSHGDLVAVALSKGWKQIVAVLATLFSGAAYLPIDYNVPENRMATILKDSGAKFLLTERELVLSEPLAVTQFVVAPKDCGRFPSILSAQTPEDIAYIIYTSGSTGQPKGVAMQHKAAMNTILDVNERFAVQPGDRVLALSRLNFDLSVYDIFGILSVGGAIVLPDEEEQKDPFAWHRLLQKESVSIWNTVPALMEMLVSYVHGKGQVLPPLLRLILMSGDWIPTHLPHAIQEDLPQAEVISLGGATEAAIWSILYPIREVDPAWNSIPYGKAMRNQEFHVLDCDQMDAPDYVPGELYIAGSGLAESYWNDSEKTAASFLYNPHNGKRMYKTGDWGRLWKDGNIEFLGRKDLQVKIHGHRIELGEVETALCRHPLVKEAIALVSEDGAGDKMLSACVIPQPTLAKVQTDLAWTDQAACFEMTAERLEEVRKGHRQINQMVLSHICAILDSFVQPFVSREVSLEEILLKGRVRKEWDQLLHLWFDYLMENGLVEQEQGVYRRTFAWQALKEVSFSSNSSLNPLMQAIQRVTEQIPDILTGKKEAFEVFFSANNPDGSVEALSLSLPGMRELYSHVARLVGQRARSEGRIRVLELGGRSGLASKLILEELQEQKVEVSYTVSDASRFLLEQAEQRLQGYPEVQFILLEPDCSLLESEGKSGSYDVILSLNALHRCADLSFALRQLDCLLQKGGLLLALELVKSHPLELLSSAILEKGYLRLADDRKERHQAILDSHSWKTKLEENCFSSVFYAVNPEAEDASYTNILTAQTGREKLDEAQLQAHLKQYLPDYMVPKIIRVAPSFPLTPNGKVDRKAMQIRVTPCLARATEFMAPQTEAESRMLKIWCEMLHRDFIGVQDNFFELGGDSLSGTLMIGKIRDEFGVETSLRDIFAYPTVDQLTRHLESQEQTWEEALPLLVPDKENRYEPFPLTDVQQAYWLGRTGAFDLGGVSTHSYFEIEAHCLDVDRLNQAFRKLIKRHDMMRVVIREQSQMILRPVPDYSIPVVDLRGWQKPLLSKKLMELRQELSHQVLSLENWPPFDIRMVLYGEDATRLLVSFDNLIFDGSSMLALFEEWIQFYEKPEREATEIPVSFRDYVLALKEWEKTDAYQKDKTYWQKKVTEIAPAPQLPLARQPQDVTSNRFARVQTVLSKTEWGIIKEQAQKYGVTPTGVLLSAFALLLSRWSKTNPFTINLTLFNRMEFHPQIKEVIGDFTSMTLLGVRVEKTETFSAYAQRLQADLWEDLSHAAYSGISVIRDYTQQNRIPLGGAVMPVVFTSALGIGPNAKDGSGITRMGELLYNITQTPQVWLDHQVYENNGALVLIWDYVQQLFPQEMMEDMFGAYEVLLHRLAQEETVWSSTVSIPLPQKQREARQHYHDSSIPYRNICLYELFQERAWEAPRRTAVFSPSFCCTYGKLYNLSTHYAQILQQLGAQTNTLVAVVMNKGWEQVAAALAIQMSGAAYLPIDPSVPLERLQYLLENGGVIVALTQPHLEETLQQTGVQVLTVKDLPFGDEPTHRLSAVAASSDLAYVIYTSGSTGNPKGVAITHRAAANTIQDINQKFHVTEWDRTFLLSNLNFDLSVYDIFGPLAQGGAIVVPEASRERDPEHWLACLSQYQVTIWNSVPALMQALTDREQGIPSTLRLVLLSGDWISLRLPDAIRSLSPNDRLQVISLGGATEASIWSIYYPIGQVDSSWNSIPYGYPLGNQDIFVFDDAYQETPDYVVGHIFIGGEGLAREYWGDQQKTQDSFIRIPYSSQRLYRTGDIGRFLPNGIVEMMGREDNQVKIRGYRIELGEIEAALEGIPGVVQSAVLVTTPEKSPTLTGFVVASGLSEQEIKSALSQKLPSYMVPSRLVILEQLPLTTNGKVDRKSLVQKVPEKEKKSSLPETQAQRILADFVREVLQCEEVSIDEKLFDMGANSLHILLLQGKVEKTFHIKMNVVHFFEYTTIRDLAEFITGNQEDASIHRQAMASADKRKAKAYRRAKK